MAIRKQVSEWLGDDKTIIVWSASGSGRTVMQRWQERTKTTSQAVYFLDVGADELYRLSLGDTSVTKLLESNINDVAYEIFRLPYGLLIALLTGHYNWSNVKTQHMSFFRKPNKLDRELHILMSYLQV